MVFIIADNKEIKRCIRKLVTLSEKGGAEFADDLVLRCGDGGSLSIEARPGNDGGSAFLIKMPGPCMVPVESFKLAITNDDLVIASHGPDVSAERVAFMEAIVELYNLTGKITTHRKTSPWALVATQRELTSYGGGKKHDNAAKFSADLPGWIDRFVLKTFLDSRTIGQKINPQAEKINMLMPVIDFTNHHCFSPGIQGLEGSGGLTIKKSQPVKGSRECFVRYGLQDIFGIFLTYGYIDESIPHVRSIAMEIDLPGFGIIRVRSQTKAEKHKNVAQQFEDLSRLYLPSILGQIKDYLDVSFLVIPGPQLPNALRRVLDILTAGMNPEHPKRADMVALAEEQVIAKNKDYYESLRTIVQALTLNDPQQETIRTDFIRMCDLQLDRLQSYKML